jgi:hypothetical protein
MRATPLHWAPEYPLRQSQRRCAGLAPPTCWSPQPGRPSTAPTACQAAYTWQPRASQLCAALAYASSNLAPARGRGAGASRAQPRSGPTRRLCAPTACASAAWHGLAWVGGAPRRGRGGARPPPNGTRHGRRRRAEARGARARRARARPPPRAPATCALAAWHGLACRGPSGSCAAQGQGWKHQLHAPSRRGRKRPPTPFRAAPRRAARRRVPVPTFTAGSSQPALIYMRWTDTACGLRAGCCPRSGGTPPSYRAALRRYQISPGPGAGACASMGARGGARGNESRARRGASGGREGSLGRCELYCAAAQAGYGPSGAGLSAPLHRRRYTGLGTRSAVPAVPAPLRPLYPNP